MTPTSLDSASARKRLAELGRSVGEREASHRPGLDRAREVAEGLRGVVCQALEAFQAAAAEAGADHLRLEVSPLRLDDKHVRAVEFDLYRGRYAGIVTVKSRGEVTLVGPFQRGKQEGPCRSFPFSANDELQSGLEEFLERFAEEASTP